jgi:hypothetical protein
MKIWADYLFTNLDEVEEEVGILSTVSMEEVAFRMQQANMSDLTLEENEGEYRRGETFRNHHYQALRPLSRMATLAGFLSLWLKKCVIPSPPRDGISIMAIFPAVDLACGKDIGLLPAMVCGIQHGLRSLRDAFCRENKKLVPPCDGRNPRIELPYAYLMAWFVMHCPALIKPDAAPENGGNAASIQRYERSQWNASYVAAARKLVRYKDSYTLFRCFPDMDGGGLWR